MQWHSYSVQIFVIGLIIIIEYKKGLFPDLRQYIYTYICIHYHIYGGMQLHLEVISTVYIMYTYIHIFTFSPYQRCFIDWNLYPPFHLTKDTSLSEISVNLFILSKIFHWVKSPCHLFTLSDILHWGKSSSHLFTLSKILHWAKSPSHLFTLSKILHWVKSPSHPSKIILSVIHSLAIWSTFFCVYIYWCNFTIACFSYALYIHALSSFGSYAVEHLIDHTFASVFKVSFTAEQTVLLWCSVMMSCYDVLLWCYVMMSCYDVMLWCPVMMSCYDVLLWCPVMMSCYDVLLWCPVMMSCYDVLLWCPVMMFLCISAVQRDMLI